MLQPVQLLRKFSQLVMREIVQDVPEDSALCEFDCKKGQCTQGEWATCERRMCRAQGELMPAPAKFQSPESGSCCEERPQASAADSE
jgi:hypothetical protein